MEPKEIMQIIFDAGCKAEDISEVINRTIDICDGGDKEDLKYVMHLAELIKDVARHIGDTLCDLYNNLEKQKFASGGGVRHEYYREIICRARLPYW